MHSTSKGPGKGFIDLHCHILPGIDDGSQSMRESLEMAQLAVENGIGTVVATPHANQRGRFENYSTMRMQEVFDSFCEELRRRRIPLRVLPGMEIFATPDVTELIRRRMLCPLAGTRYFLIEFPFHGSADDMEVILAEMLKHQYVPIIAHPERYACIQHEPGRIAKLREAGCVVQVNRGSVQGRFGRRCAAAAAHLLDNGLIDVFGSDAHGAEFRTPELRSLWGHLECHYGSREAKRLMFDNPGRLLQNQNLRRECAPIDTTGESAP